MRLFLDAHISGRRVAQALRDNGYDVRAADEERALDGLDDESLFVLAADEGRILVTFNLKDFLPIMNAWAMLAARMADAFSSPVPSGMNNLAQSSPGFDVRWKRSASKVCGLIECIGVQRTNTAVEDAHSSSPNTQ